METEPDFTLPRLVRAGLDLGEGPIPLLAGALHYFRTPKAEWPDALNALKRMGVRIVDTCVPWSLHQDASSEFHFARENERDLPGFLRAVAAAEMLCSLRLGPAVNAELNGFGIPSDVLWDDACQARSPTGARVIVPALPRAFPAPSLASAAFLNEAAHWLSSVGDVLAPFAFPNGPIVLLHLDSTASFFFRDALYDQDYHPDAIEGYRRFIRERYVTEEALRNAYGDSGLTFETLKPPERLNAQTAKGLARHLNWAEFQEQLIAQALSLFAATLREKPALRRLPVCHNLARTAPHTALHAGLAAESVPLLGQNFHHGPGETWALRAQADPLWTRATRTNVPAFASELGAGFALHLGARSEEASHFSALAALAYGVNAFNIYMAVGRDRWVGAPIDQHGNCRPGFEFWQRLLVAISESELWKLRRAVEVFVVVPRSYRRLCRTFSALGPINLGVLSLLGQGPEDACTEERFGLNHPVVEDVELFARNFGQALDQAGIPFAWCSDEDFDYAVNQGRWVVVASPGALPVTLLQKMQEAAQRGVSVSVGPHDPVRDEYWNALKAPLPPLTLQAGLPFWIGNDPKQHREAAQSFLKLPGVLSTAPGAPTETTLFLDDSGDLRVAFLINATGSSHEALLASTKPAMDALTLETFEPQNGTLKLPLKTQSVRMLRF
ncbi:MAG: beta-galactosidase [Polyangiaceae bacterium]|nr:beta-galactosidase [Polyangiaceae bacterium]